MADKETGLNIEVNAVANEKSAEQAVNKLADGVEKASKKGRIEVPVSINTLIDNKDTESKLSKAQKDVVKAINKMSKKGFSASAKDIDALNSKMTEFGHQMDQAGKGRQNKVFREIRKQVDELNKSYKALQLDTKSARVRDTKTSRSKSKPRRKQDKFNPDFGPVSDESIEASTRQHQKRQLKGLKSVTQGLGYRNKGIDPGKTSVHMMKLSEYSAHGSNWANELARTLKEEMKKSAKTLVKYIDPVAAKNAKGGRPTDEKTFLNAVIKNVLGKLTDSIIKLEAGDKTITLDTLKEQAATIKVLSNNAGKTTEQAMKAINGAIQSVYSETENPKRRHRLGGTGREEGTEKGIGPGHELAKSLQNQLYKSMNAWNDEVIADVIAKEVALGTDKVAKEVKKDTKKTKVSQATKVTDELKSTDKYKADMAKLNAATNKTHAEIRNSMKATRDTTKATRNTTKAIDRNTTYDKIENVAERIADSKQQKTSDDNKNINKDTARAVKEDVKTGFNTDSNATAVISVLQSIFQTVSEILNVLRLNGDNKLALPEPKDTEQKSVKEVWESIKHATDLTNEQKQQMLADASNAGKQKKKTSEYKAQPKLPGGPPNEPPKSPESEQPEGYYTDKVKKSTITASPIHQTIWDKLEDKINDLTGATEEYKKVINSTAEDQDKLAAERIKKYGLNNGRNPNDTGDIASIRRALELFRTNKRSIEDNEELSQKIQLTEGVKVDTTEITKAFNKVLSGKQMRNAQMGGSIPRQILGAFTGFAGMPSIEKSRAQADGLNQIMGNINKALNSVLSSIQMKETELSGLEKSGQAKFNDKGEMTYGTSAAKKTFVDLEEYKLVLQTILADMNMVDSIVDSTDGKFSKLVKRLNFTSPVLRENNDILRNINAGLDKGGKALKFQTRWAEILNYTFQLISRSVGQWVKKVLSMLNPFNILKNTIKGIVGLTKNLFSDFASYDTKWQRTMNVVKINFQRVMKPAMEWIAQKIVNIIGYFDVASQAFQRVFGKIPISLFDQAGADAEKIRREMEEAANVTLGFDELHDIGTDQSGANDLLGDIYKPQLDPKWVEQFDKLGEVLGKFFKGDLGFGDVCKQILKMLGMLLGDIGKAIWDWFSNTKFGSWIIEHWKGILATILALFLGWQLLKIFGPTLLGVIGKALKSLGGLVWTGLKGVGSKLLDVLCGTQFGSDMVRGFKAMFNSGGMIGTFKAGGASLGAIFAQALVAVAGVAIATGSIMKGFDMVADDASYNIGLMENGGDEKDKKSGFAGKAVGTLGGAAGGALAGLAIGGPIGAAIGAGIGAIAGLITTSLAPAFEQAEVAARKANNEMQKIEYYEGAVKGAQTQVDKFDELLDMSNQTLQAQSDKVYTLGEKYGVSKTQLDTLVQAMKDGNYSSEMAVGLNSELVTALDQLDWHYQNNAGLTDKLTEAKKKLQKAELDLAIANDIEAGNFEMAAARIEYAMAAGLYETDEAAKKMSQIMKETSFTENKELLNNMSPELRAKWEGYAADTEEGKDKLESFFKDISDSERKELLNSNDKDLKQKWFEYATTTEAGKKELAKMYAEMNEEERKAFTQDYSSEAGGAMGKAIDAMQQEINSATFDWSHPFKSLGSMFTGDWSWKAKYASFDVGTNYVPNDGFAMVHKGEAIIPKDENVFAKQGKAWDGQMAMNSQMMNAITRLEQTIAQGINVKGEFRQRGNDLVATVEKNKNKQSNNVLNNKVYAR